MICMLRQLQLLEVSICRATSFHVVGHHRLQQQPRSWHGLSTWATKVSPTMISAQHPCRPRQESSSMSRYYLLHSTPPQAPDNAPVVTVKRTRSDNVQNEEVEDRTIPHKETDLEEKELYLKTKEMDLKTIEADLKAKHMQLDIMLMAYKQKDVHFAFYVKWGLSCSVIAAQLGIPCYVISNNMMPDPHSLPVILPMWSLIVLLSIIPIWTEVTKYR